MKATHNYVHFILISALIHKYGMELNPAWAPVIACTDLHTSVKPGSLRAMAWTTSSAKGLRHFQTGPWYRSM